MRQAQVKCQANGTSTRTVLRELQAMGSKRAGVALLYKGLGPSAVAAALIGALYLSSFHLFTCVHDLRDLRCFAWPADNHGEMPSHVRPLARTPKKQNQCAV